MADLDALVQELAPGLMLWRARSVTAREISNEVGDVADLTDEERADLCDRIATAIETADITIDLEA
jgi:hypothetical protein